MLLLTLFALGILLIDLMLPKEWKRVNAITALIGLAFSAAAVGKLHYAYHVAEAQGRQRRGVHRLHGLAAGRSLRASTSSTCSWRARPSPS